MKKYICGVVTGVVIASVIGVGAAGIWDNISVLRNDINVVVDGQEIQTDNFLYKDTTYVPLRAVSSALGEAVVYDETSNTAFIGERKEDNIMKSKYTPPDELMNSGIYIVCENGVYYILPDYIYDKARDKGLSTNFEDVLNSHEILTVEIGDLSWETVLIGVWRYIPYDTYVDEIEPLLR